MFLKGAGQTHGDLVIDGAGATTPAESTPIADSITFDNVVLRNNARVVADVPVLANDTVSVLSGSVLTHSLAHEPGLHIEAGRVFKRDGEVTWRCRNSDTFTKAMRRLKRVRPATIPKPILSFLVKTIEWPSRNRIFFQDQGR